MKPKQQLIGLASPHPLRPLSPSAREMLRRAGTVLPIQQRKRRRRPQHAGIAPEVAALLRGKVKKL